MDYDLEIPKVIKAIRQSKAKRVCLQFPDGLKPFALDAIRKIQKKTKAEIFIWAGSNFGACDLPLHLKDFGFDLLVNFGHAPFRK